MNRKGLELLKQIDAFPKELNDLLENDLLPYQFKLFIKNYKIGQCWTNGELMLLNEESGDMLGLTQISMYEPETDNPQTYHACLDYIFGYHQLQEEINKYHQRIENWNDLGFIQIGLMHWSDVLLLGVEETNKDEIWRYGTGIAAQTCTKLEDNIYEFIARLRESIDYETLEDHQIIPDKVYRNLNESFWRFKK